MGNIRERESDCERESAAYGDATLLEKKHRLIRLFLNWSIVGKKQVSVEKLDLEDVWGEQKVGGDI